MAGVPAGLPAGIRISDHISLGVIARAFPPERVQQILAETGKASERERDLPAQVMVYYAIGLAHPRGSALSAGRATLAVGCRGRQGGGQEWHLAGPQSARRSATAPAVRAGGTADCDARHQGGVVSAVAAGEPGR